MARSFFIKSLFLICLWLGFGEGYAQKIEVAALPDTNTFLIGEQIKIKLEAKIPESGDINFPVFSDTLINEVEILEASSVDSVEEKGYKKLWMDLTVTSFDSGFHAIPPLQFIGREPGNPLKSYHTEAFLLEVQTVAVDTSKAIMSIKEPIVVPVSFQEMLPYILSGILVLGLAALGFWFWKKQQNKPIEEKKEIIPQEPPHVIALRDLEQLEAKQMWQKGEFKDYHSELTEIIRRYIENRYKIPALEQVSDEILQSFSNSGVLKEKEYDNLRSMLNLADMVKFAKVHPLPNENERSMELAVEFVDNTKYSENIEKEVV